jgi:hypothetical protein
LTGKLSLHIDGVILQIDFSENFKFVERGSIILGSIRGHGKRQYSRSGQTDHLLQQFECLQLLVH